MKKLRKIAVILSFVFVASLTGCACKHDTWNEATCTEPKTCVKCGEIEGEALGHAWINADCVNPKTCKVCGETEGKALGHTWIEATYDAPQTCSVCGETTGTALERPAITINIATYMPALILEYNNNNKLHSMIDVTEVTYDIQESYGDKYDVTFYFSGEKTWDVNGSNHSDISSVALKITDEDGYIVDDAIFYTSSLVQGDKFKGQTCTISLPAGTYKIKLDSIK